jgi:hypothetical protein
MANYAIDKVGEALATVVSDSATSVKAWGVETGRHALEAATQTWIVEKARMVCSPGTVAYASAEQSCFKDAPRCIADVIVVVVWAVFLFAVVIALGYASYRTFSLLTKGMFVAATGLRYAWHRWIKAGANKAGATVVKACKVLASPLMLVIYGRPKPIELPKVVEAHTEKLVDLRAATWTTEVWNQVKCWVTTVDGVKYLAPKFKRNKRMVGVTTLERATDSGRIAASQDAKVPSCSAYFYDVTANTVVANAARIALVPDKEPCLVTNRHVVRDLNVALSAGHDVVLKRLGNADGKGIPVSLEGKRGVLDVSPGSVTCIRGLDMAKIPLDKDLASQLGLKAADVARTAPLCPEWWYKTNASPVAWVTASRKVISTQVPFQVMHDGNTEGGASGCIGFRRSGGNKWEAAYLHWGAHQSVPLNHAINLVELYKTPTVAQVKAESDLNYATPRTMTDADFDPDDIVNMAFDPDADKAMAVDSMGRVGWVQSWSKNQHGDAVIDWGNRVDVFDEDYDMYEFYIPEQQGDFDPRRHALQSGFTNWNAFQKTKKGQYAGVVQEETTPEEALQLKKEKAELGKKMAEKDAELAELRRQRKEADEKFKAQSAELKRVRDEFAKANTAIAQQLHEYHSEIREDVSQRQRGLQQILDAISLAGERAKADMAAKEAKETKESKATGSHHEELRTEADLKAVASLPDSAVKSPAASPKAKPVPESAVTPNPPAIKAPQPAPSKVQDFQPAVSTTHQ